MKSNLQSAIFELFGNNTHIIKRNTVSGGDINQTAILTLSGGQRIFIKENRAERIEMFVAEAKGLKALNAVASRSASPPASTALKWGINGQKAFLLLEEIQQGTLKSGFDFGQSLAELHRSGRNDACGFDENNWIGSTPQKNTWNASWHDFFSENRLGIQWAMVRRNGLGDAHCDKSMEFLRSHLANMLPDVDGGHASLLHGDLWGGNWMATTEGQAQLIDPAVYYGHREADLAMTQLFGGFPSGFYEGYTHHWPLEPGFDERRDIYNLYHLLNHVNLFGSSYWNDVQRILQRF